jgi:hypothetical protein
MFKYLRNIDVPVIARLVEMCRGRHLGFEDTLRIVVLRGCGFTESEIAKAFGTSRSSVSRRLMILSDWFRENPEVGVRLCCSLFSSEEFVKKTLEDVLKVLQPAEKRG